ncbi:MAG TPA: BPSS1780 family membrane protein [Burkholderiales bacterium]|nr:BPSS1780 family membrane protein [Burkholderiales bacterium]
MTTNPYSAPAAPVADPEQALLGNFVPGGRGVASGRGASWFGEAWQLFKTAPVLWIAIWIVMVLILIALNFIPLLGGLANALLWPVFSAGLMLGCQAIASGGKLEFGHLFAGFRDRLGTLAGIGGLTLLASVAIGAIVVSAMGLGLSTLLGTTRPATPEAAVTTLLAGLIMLALMLPLFMAMWFAPALVVFNERGALEAMVESFRGCLKNVGPFLVYGLVGLLLTIAATIPLGLGWLVLGPMSAASIYAGYRDIYFRP